MRIDRTGLLEGVSGAARARRERALELAEAALDAVEPGPATTRAIERLERAGERLEGVALFAFGKAAVPMARAALRRVRVRDGIVVALEEVALPGVDVRRGAHPDPAPDAARVGAEVLERARALGPDDVALCLVSGGGSAMLELPAPGVTIAEMARVARALMKAGADIAELNAVRRALSQLKGGGLAAAIAPARVCNVILSDVPGLGPEVVASGPTCPAPEGAPDPSAVLARYGLLDAVSSAIRAALAAPRPSVSSAIRSEIAADNRTACDAIVTRAGALGITVEARPGVFSGEARELGERIAREAASSAWVWGGESTVTVRGRGRGGRNQELVLGALAAGWTGGLLLAFGTDGVDGASDAAGALIDDEAAERAERLGLDARAALAENASHAFFASLGTQLRTGPTGTNVADIALFLP